MLEEEGALVRVEDRVIPTPFGDRSGVTIEPWLTDQWYVDAAKLALPATPGGEERRHQDRARDLGQDLVQLARKYPALVRLAPAVVGAPDSGLVRTARHAADDELSLHFGVTSHAAYGFEVWLESNCCRAEDQTGSRSRKQRANYEIITGEVKIGEARPDRRSSVCAVKLEAR